MFDDYPNIVDNASLRVFDGSFQSLVVASSEGRASPLRRPLSVASFALNWHASGANPFAFKLVNLLIHLANGILIFLLAQLLLARFIKANDQKSAHIALWVAAVWLLHPMNLTPVLFAVQRMTGLAALFSLAALNVYLYGRQMNGGKALAMLSISLLLFWPASILSKETGLLLPVFIFLCEWLILRSLNPIPQKTKWLVAIACSMALGGVLIASWNSIIGGYAGRDFGLLERLMTEARVLWFYILQLLAPLPNFFGLYHDDIPISHSLAEPPQTLIAILAWAAIIALAAYQRSKWPLFAFAVFWFLAAHALESTLLPLEIAFEHRNYLASFGIFLWLGLLLFRLQTPKDGQVARITLALSFLFFCGLITALRASEWGDEYRRTQLEAMAHPNSYRSNYDAAVIIVRRTFDSGGGNSLAYQMAEFHYKRAAELNPNNIAPYLGLLNLDCATDRPKNPEVQTRLKERLSRMRFNADNQSAINSLSGLFVEGRLCLDANEVKTIIDAALSNPAAQGHWRAVLYAVAMDYAAAKLKMMPIALAYAKAAVDADPQYPAFRINLVNLLLATHEYEKAREAYQVLRKMKISAYDKAAMHKLDNFFNHLETHERDQR